MALDTLRKAIEESDAITAEQFISGIMIGECPKCGNKNTKDCEEIEGIEEISVGICMNCGFLWCSECGRQLIDTIRCKHWEICDKCDQADDMGICSIDPIECEKLDEELD